MASVVSVIAVVESVIASVVWVTDVVGACAGGLFVPPLSSPHAATAKASAPDEQHAGHHLRTLVHRDFSLVGGTSRCRSHGGDTGTR